MKALNHLQHLIMVLPQHYVIMVPKQVKFLGICLKDLKASYTHRKVVNIYIVYELNKIADIGDNLPTLKNALFGAVMLTKNTDIDKYGYSGYRTGFDRRSSFPFPGGGFGQNVIIFRVDICSSVQIDNKKQYILILGKGPTQGLEHTLIAERMYSINVTVPKKKFYLSLHYNGANSYLFINGPEI